jgi:glucan 1,3-beta-glucosidase
MEVRFGWGIFSQSGVILNRTIYRYFLQVLGWARKYGLRVLLDLHALPGSQNGAQIQHIGLSSCTNP